MYKKLAKDAAVVFFAYFWSLALVGKLVAAVVYAIFPHDIVASAVIPEIGFVLAYIGAWFFFNKWRARFWIKAAVAGGVFVVFFVVGGLIDAAIVRNMPYPK